MTFFKFQSDSINTSSQGRIEGGVVTLNSNLILLIRKAILPNGSLVEPFKFQSDSINTGTLSPGDFVLISFKFQSDSINTGKCF